MKIGGGDDILYNQLKLYGVILNIEILKNKFKSCKPYLTKAVICFFAGTLYAAALPPFNIEIAAFFMLIPLLWVISKSRPFHAAVYGWIWGIGWSFFSYRFLREIDPIIPFLMPPVMSLWPAVWAYITAWFIKKSEKNILTMSLFVFGCAALFTLIEWSRSRLFVWNDSGVTQWRNIPLIQLAAVTGSYGVNYVVALTNTAIYSLFFKRLRYAAILPVIMIATIMIWGNHRAGLLDKNQKKQFVWKPVLIQGDLSQRRHATLEQATEALDIYGTLSLQALKKYPESRFIIWPESAIPLTYFTTVDMRKVNSSHPHALNTLRYQELIRLLTSNYHCRMLIGALDCVRETPQSQNLIASNSALYFDENSTLQRKYNKIHRVPFGEYIPFRKFIPSFITNYIDMGRDIVSGTDHEPIQLAPGVNAGVVICYEGVFSYITRESAKRGANVLIALSNDAWYPLSSEPEQHLANAVMRAVETGLPMIRSGNNGGSGVITPTGRFTQCYGEKIKRPELWRGRTINQIKVALSSDVRRTIYVRYGEYFILILTFITASWMLYVIAANKKDKK